MGEDVCVSKSNAHESLLVEKKKYFICLGKTACNLIKQCYGNNNNNNTIFECNHEGITACKVNTDTFFI